MKFSRIVVIWLTLLVFSPVSTKATESMKSYLDTLFNNANNAYKLGDYDSAMSLYSAIAVEGYESAPLYFNLGNCFYKKGNVPGAILYYERARRLDPSDGDIAFNLQMANTRVSDRIDPLQSVILVRWWRDAAFALSHSTWAWLFLLAVCLASAGIALFFLSRLRGWRQTGLVASISGISFGVVFFALANTGLNALSADEGIIFAPTVNVRSEPANNAPIQFVIHEGVKVNIELDEGEWMRIRIADGNSGWIPSPSLERI